MNKKPVHVYVVLRHSVDAFDVQEKILGVYSSRLMAERAVNKYISKYRLGSFLRLAREKNVSVLKFTVKGMHKEVYKYFQYLREYKE